MITLNKALKLKKLNWSKGKIQIFKIL